MSALRKASVTPLPVTGWPTRAELSGALADLRRRYQREVRAIAGRLALQFQARRFDARKPEEEWEKEPGTVWCPGLHPFCVLEDLCEALPMCQDAGSARLVLSVSRYADWAASVDFGRGETAPCEGYTWRSLAAKCVSRDVHDYAIRRGWASSRLERGDS